MKTLEQKKSEFARFISASSKFVRYRVYVGSIAPARKTVFHWLVRIKFVNHQRECVVVMETLPNWERALEQVLKHSFILPKQDVKKLCYLFQKLFINPFLILLILFHYLIVPFNSLSHVFCSILYLFSLFIHSLFGLISCPNYFITYNLYFISRFLV